MSKDNEENDVEKRNRQTVMDVKETTRRKIIGQKRIKKKLLKDNGKTKIVQ